MVRRRGPFFDKQDVFWHARPFPLPFLLLGFFHNKVHKLVFPLWGYLRNFLQSCKHTEEGTEDRLHELGLLLTSPSLLQLSAAHRSKHNEVDLVIQQN